VLAAGGEAGDLDLERALAEGRVAGDAGDARAVAWAQIPLEEEIPAAGEGEKAPGP
jgi:hypothetical protein